MTRVIGIDTSLRSTGVAVVEARGSSLVPVEYGTIRTAQQKPLSECLVNLHGGLTALIDRTSPTAVALEGVFFSKNVRTAVVLGEARGTAIAACAVKRLPVCEYAPRRVKQAIVGFGSASKAQVRKMVMTLLALEEEPQEDAGDALAIAICHLHSTTRVTALEPKTI